jgi:hypothetical protein
MPALPTAMARVASIDRHIGFEMAVQVSISEPLAGKHAVKLSSANTTSTAPACPGGRRLAPS